MHFVKSACLQDGVLEFDTLLYVLLNVGTLNDLDISKGDVRKCYILCSRVSKLLYLCTLVKIPGHNYQPGYRYGIKF